MDLVVQVDRLGTMASPAGSLVPNHLTGIHRVPPRCETPGIRDTEMRDTDMSTAFQALRAQQRDRPSADTPLGEWSELCLS